MHDTAMNESNSCSSELSLAKRFYIEASVYQREVQCLRENMVMRVSWSQYLLCDAEGD